MKRIDLTITAQAPLAIGQRKPGGSVSEAMDYIPGSVIRGAIAGKLLQHGTPETGDDFHRLFIEEEAAIFQNAYPAIAKLGEDNYTVSPGEIRVLPATALSSKTDSGFKKSPNDGRSGVFDSLIDSYCAREHGLFYEPNDLKGDRVEPFGGFYSYYEDDETQRDKPWTRYVSHSVSKRLLTRVGINRRRATAQDEILYSLEVLNETQGKAKRQSTVYRSSILVNDDNLAEELCAFIGQERDRFRLGGAASRGLGKVEVSVKLEDVADSTTNVERRIYQFNHRLKDDRWQQWSQFASGASSIADKTFFSISLESDAILTENWRRTFVLSAEILSRLAELPESKVTLEMAYSSYDYRSGWNAAWGLPKDVELITKMGSVFLFNIPEVEQDNWIKKLANLESQGVGDRTSEGFGQIKVCDEFHRIMREEPV
ncbi:CRISPR-associated RAMP protein Csx10 [Oscillatoria sp. CS-180]|uniref:type III-D CRISPR-associated RAMP protein Csx10 n=1 Tax=Oscillatoria sp. CS-180 TaxID=3021720 RepID=UPI00232C12FE|nr:CRISPR-associated RAMP protein Csx10 [Oscillatoria sp. CS-180]MDB9526788.1 CRISPR-associated RAMP protein Csx10 [Oscillatoria sp. CS-180]